MAARVAVSKVALSWVAAAQEMVSKVAPARMAARVAARHAAAQEAVSKLAAEPVPDDAASHATAK